jgi:iron(II)-dependent oxidoreductase
MAGVKRASGIRDELNEARTLTDDLFSVVRADSFYERPIPIRHRIIFYLGHLEAFDWNLIGRHVLEEPSFHPEFDQLFAFGIDPDSTQAPKDEQQDWPAVEDVVNYVSQLRRRLDNVFDAVDELYLHVALEHRLMHAETFAYILHHLPYDRKIAPEDGHSEGLEIVNSSSVEIPSGSVALGLARGESFGWDNEFNKQVVDVPAFAIGKYKVTNGDYLRFVEDGGPAPHFWSSRSEQWFYKGMFAEVPLPLSWPVYVSHDQAQAYADWSGKRLPSEPEFQRAAFGGPEANGVRDNFNFQRWDPQPVNIAAENKFGVSGMVGNGWEWTSTVFGPFPGFERFPFYPGYSADFFDDEHYVLKGASPRTASRLVRPSFRNWFRSSYPYAYTTFRLVEK